MICNVVQPGPLTLTKDQDGDQYYRDNVIFQGAAPILLSYCSRKPGTSFRNATCERESTLSTPSVISGPDVEHRPTTPEASSRFGSGGGVKPYLSVGDAAGAMTELGVAVTVRGLEPTAHRTPLL